MAISVFVPRRLSVGFQGRKDTYSGKLAYVTYTDEKGVLRKEGSWTGWRDAAIAVLEADNTPISGFVINKKIGGYRSGWDARASYVRVFDPRGFEFEMSIPNLVYVLENTNSIKGKGLEGDFVYGWAGTDLLLIPTGAPDYPEMIAARDAIFDGATLKPKELVLGGTYRNRKGVTVVFMGRFEGFEPSYYSHEAARKRGKIFFFYEPEGKEFITVASLGSTIVACLDETPIGNYAKLFEKLESDPRFSPPDETQSRFVPFTLAEFEKTLHQNDWGNVSFCHDGKVYFCSRRWDPRGRREEAPQYEVVKNDDRLSGYGRNGSAPAFDSPAQAFAAYAPQHKDQYLTNGKFYRREI